MGAELQSVKKRKVHFVIQKEIEFGKAIYVVGNIPQIGCWRISNSLKLSWNKNHFWTGFIELPTSELEHHIEYKFAIANWDQPECSHIQWEAGQSNRLLDCSSNNQHVVCENSWNMQKITLHLIVPDECRNEQYFVTGDCKQLGNWRTSIKLKRNKNSSMISLLNINKLERGQKYIIFSLSFQIFRAKTKIRYCYIKKTQDYEIQRQPGRKYEINSHSNSHPKCLKILHPHGDTEMYETCNFQQLHYSKITNNIFLGPYLKNSDDFKILKEQGISSILSIQTEEDLDKHKLTQDYLHEQSQKNGIKLYQYAIQDMSKKDFLSKYMGAIDILKRLIQGNQKVYVHCTAGVYRSPQIVILFLVMSQKLKPQQAIELVQSRHPFARPNTKIVSQALSLLIQAKN